MKTDQRVQHLEDQNGRLRAALQMFVDAEDSFRQHGSPDVRYPPTDGDEMSDAYNNAKAVLATLKAEAPLFIPLRLEYFFAFASGDKTEEYRKLGSRWNERTCHPGRAVVLSGGYGKKHRLNGRITYCHVDRSPDDRPGWVACYGTNAGPALVIGIELTPTPKGAENE